METPRPPHGLLHTRAGELVHLAGGSLRCGARDAAPRNVAVLPAGDGHALLVGLDPATGEPASVLTPRADGVLVPRPHDGAGFWRLEQESGLTVLRCGSGWLTARDGRLHAGARADDGACTRFAILSSVTDRCLAALAASSWVDGSGRPGTPEIAFQPVPLLTLGGQSIELAGLPGPCVIDDCGRADGPVRGMLIAGPGGRLHRLVRYRPVICFAVFGSDEYYHLLGLAVRSLRRFGGYDGAVCIAADRPRDVVAGFLPKRVDPGWKHVSAAAADGLFIRYALPDWGLDEYQPVLYLDTDVVANAPLQPLLGHLAAGSGIHLATEPDWAHAFVARTAREAAGHPAGNWFGAWLLAADPALAGAEVVAASSRIIGAARAEDLRCAFEAVRRLKRTADPVAIQTYTDQPLLNYVLRVIGQRDVSQLDGFVTLARNGRTARALPPRGLIHFHTGVGRGHFKLNAVRTYLKQNRSIPATTISPERA